MATYPLASGPVGGLFPGGESCFGLRCGPLRRRLRLRRRRRRRRRRPRRRRPRCRLPLGAGHAEDPVGQCIAAVSRRAHEGLPIASGATTGIVDRDPAQILQLAFVRQADALVRLVHREDVVALVTAPCQAIDRGVDAQLAKRHIPVGAAEALVHEAAEPRHGLTSSASLIALLPLALHLGRRSTSAVTHRPALGDKGGRGHEGGRRSSPCKHALPSADGLRLLRIPGVRGQGPEAGPRRASADRCVPVHLLLHVQGGVVDVLLQPGPVLKQPPREAGIRHRGHLVPHGKLLSARQGRRPEAGGALWRQLSQLPVHHQDRPACAADSGNKWPARCCNDLKQ